MAFILGKDFMLFLTRDNTEGPIVPVCYAQNVTLTIENELLEASVAPNATWRNYYPGLLQYKIDCSGLVNLDADTYSALEMQKKLISRTAMKWKCQDVNNDNIWYSGQVYFQSIQEDSSYDNVNTFSASAQGDGPLEIHEVAPGGDSNIYYGVQDTNADPVDFARFIQSDPTLDIVINYTVVNTPKFFWMAHSAAFPTKTLWQDINDPNNSGVIGDSSNLFSSRPITIGGNPFTLYITNYLTGFNGGQSLVKYYRP